MEHSFKVGISFGLTSATITTLGLMVGLEAGTSSRLAVIGGVLTIAIADAFSDALGIHVSEESENVHTRKEIWTATLSTFFAKAIFASIFIIPILLLPLTTAVWINVAIGMVVLGIFSYMIAKDEGGKPRNVIGEHLLIAVVVITITHFLGVWISNVFR
ncbi:MAG: hypothetical protein PHY34_00830 [Patescibacteria group bacterium]|nr:hypothetical protein [Patescibacteria group bacterium]MDD5715826.1 hypothetical protein [Patescibacteria group bacterium]